MTDELLIKFLLKETSEEEGIAVQNWLDAAPSNAKHFEQFKQIWNSSKKLSTQSNVNGDEAWLRFKQRASAAHQPLVRRIKPTYQWLKIAAVLFLIAAIWSVYSIFSPVSYTPITAGNTINKQLLPDGSEITLNKNTQLSYATNFKKNRSVHLQQGEVFFNVLHDKTRPFVIDVDKIAVLVVGTSFNVKHLNHQTEVIVETGIVKVSLGKDEIALHKGEKIIIKNTTDKLVKMQSTDQLYNYYRSNEFVLNNTPLWRVVEVLNEAYNSEIVIKDPAIRDLTLFTTLKTTASLADNLKTICLTLDLKSVRNENQLLLSKNTK
ncbi:ferric-dicitrate binding protein FerR (iron transport regulator) [Pedobacter sp. AK017]|uniref:FecR family protein n=1 Tax=Pedobacter sp. AK017 TaxID=2723073 RepID=UPI0016110D5F|nr:FecR domain-containing protein [Pedobacter sp. AK017]MBB5436409.1 ferric-dicitrate binding protein FerR (iron transport regulator) [Pedobacter sp. AK017]